MRELNQAWSTLSNKEKRSEYDLKISTEKSDNRSYPSFDGGSYEEWIPEPTQERTTPRYATEEEMRITWFAKLVKPLPLGLIFVVVVTVAIIATVGIGNNDASNRPVPAVKANRSANRLYELCCWGKGERVKCVSGEYDAIIYRIVPVGEGCPKDLKLIYKRDGDGEVFCVFEDNNSN